MKNERRITAVLFLSACLVNIIYFLSSSWYTKYCLTSGKSDLSADLHDQQPFLLEIWFAVNKFLYSAFTLLWLSAVIMLVLISFQKAVKLLLNYLALILLTSLIITVFPNRTGAWRLDTLYWNILTGIIYFSACLACLIYRTSYFGKTEREKSLSVTHSIWIIVPVVLTVICACLYSFDMKYHFLVSTYEFNQKTILRSAVPFFFVRYLAFPQLFQTLEFVFAAFSAVSIATLCKNSFKGIAVNLTAAAIFLLLAAFTPGFVTGISPEISQSSFFFYCAVIYGIFLIRKIRRTIQLSRV